jgi:hypothetical protein
MAAPTMQEIKGYAISNDDINKVLEPDTKIFTYPELSQMGHIDEAFDSLGRCVMLFLVSSPTSGHWLTMFKRDARTVEYFDSYGERPDSQRKWLEPDMLARLGQSEPMLTNLLRASRYRVYYNTYPYQTDRADVATCGRWCLARLICKDLSNLQFHNLVKADMKKRGLKSMDDWVAVFTYEMLGK